MEQTYSWYDVTWMTEDAGNYRSMSQRVCVRDDVDDPYDAAYGDFYFCSIVDISRVGDADEEDFKEY